MILEEQRYIAEDLERLEQGIADRMSTEPSFIRDRLNRDHEVSQLLDQISRQSSQMLTLYADTTGARSREVLSLGSGDPFEEFYTQANEIKDYHARNPTEQAENSELRYKPRRQGEAEGIPHLVDTLFSGEEAFGRFFDLHTSHEAYNNLPGVKRLAYLHYLDVFDKFETAQGGVKRAEKVTDQYFQYVGELGTYLEGFMRKTRPLEDIDKVIINFDTDFDMAWDHNEVPGWSAEKSTATTNGNIRQLSTPDAVWCEACEKEFKNDNVYKGHLPGKKHIKAAEALAKRGQQPNGTSKASSGTMQERAVAQREYKVKRLANAMSTERDDTRVNVERRQGMTERERQQELDNLNNMTELAPQSAQEPNGDTEGQDGDDANIYNPLKLPLAWDGKPIPYWLYRLHGLGVEFPCEICGQFVYMGRRAYEKHFNEARHIYGLKRLGISDTHLFRDITHIEQAVKLWEKIQRDEKKSRVDDGSIVQMEDAEGNVMPEKVYYDLQKQGLL